MKHVLVRKELGIFCFKVVPILFCRVFYQLARTGVRKRLVILLDSSKSMNDDFVDGHSKFSVAKTAALALLEPLNVLDSVCSFFICSLLLLLSLIMLCSSCSFIYF